MPAALFMVDVLERNRAPYAKTLLLNSEKVLDMKPDSQYPTTRVTFWYLEAEDGREKSVEYTANHFINTLVGRMIEVGNVQFPWIHVLTEQSFTGREKAVNGSAGEMRKLNTNRLVKGYDNADGLTSYITIERGAFKTIEWKTSHLIADISQAASASRSLSQS